MKRPNWNLIKGKTINYLTIIEKGEIKNNKQKILVRCVCGIEKRIQLNNINSGSIKSCGCKKSEIISRTNTIHGMRGLNGIYNIFRGIRQRCLYKKGKDYKDYGGRGIICEWENFEDFYKDMGVSYEKGLTIDRIDNNGNYCKENCRWATMKQQANNKRNNTIIIYKGKKYTLSQLSEKLGIDRFTIINKLKRNTGIAKVYLQ